MGRAALVANAVRRRLAVAIVIDGATLGTGIAAGHAADQFLVVDLQFDDGGELDPLVAQHRLGRIRLDEGARKAVENEAIGTVGLADPLDRKSTRLTSSH